MNYYLVGYMYCGKSTFGRKLAAERGMEFLDIDRAFEARYHYTVPMFFSRFGEAAFRKLETQLLRSIADLDNHVIATGGGTPCHSGNMDFILEHGSEHSFREHPLFVKEKIYGRVHFSFFEQLEA